MYHEVAELEKEGRLEFHTLPQMKESMNTLVRSGHHVIIDTDVSLKNRIGYDFSEKGNTPKRHYVIEYSFICMFI